MLHDVFASFERGMKMINGRKNAAKHASYLVSRMIMVVALFTLSITLGACSYMEQDTMPNENLSLYMVSGMLFVVVVIFLMYVISNQRARKQLLFDVAYTDSLTGISNLQRFKMDAKDLLENNVDKSYTMVIFDINRFSILNDLYGTEEGDETLKAIAGALKKQVDAKSELVARIQMDCFALLCARTDGSELGKMLDTVRDQASSRTRHTIRFSVGHYVIHEGETDVSRIYEKANYAHNMAKANAVLGGVYEYDDEVRKQDIRDREIEAKMERALSGKEFTVYLQPKYRLEDEKLIGAESLVRWVEPDGTFVFPSDFIPLFEKNGFIVKLDKYMFEESCRILKSWMEKGNPLITISVNFSRLHLSNPAFVEELVDIAEQYDIPKKYLEIELTESVMFDNEKALEAVLAQLHAGGFTVSMDDFGSGYSSLGLLKNLHVDVIKIDRSFFTDNRYKTRARTVLQSIFQMAKELGIHTLAEGVESEEHVELLKSLGCQSVQGYYFSRPMPADRFSSLDTARSPSPAPDEFELTLQSLGNIELGRGEIGDMVPVLVYRMYAFAMQEALVKQYGVGEMEETIHLAGKIAGRMLSKDVLNVDLPFEDFTTTLANTFEEMKVGKLNVEMFDEATHEMTITIDDDADCSGTQDMNKVLCHFDAGLIAGVLLEYEKRPFSVVEVDCWANGADTCRFFARPT